MHANSFTDASVSVAQEEAECALPMTADKLAISDEIFRRITTKLAARAGDKRAYWGCVADMQLLANLGYPQAKTYMRRIDISRAPICRNQRTAHSWLTSVPAGVAFKGMRRQLHADPASPNKTFGMRPLWARDDNCEQL